MSLEESDYFSLERHQTIQKDFWTLSEAGWGVGSDALREYRHGGEKMIAVGSIRAKKVIDAGRRCAVRDGPFGGATSSSAGNGITLDYDAFVSFFVCEEALAVSEIFSEGDIRYCFKIVDDRGEGRLDLAVVKTLYDDLVKEWVSADEKKHEFRMIEQIVSQYFDVMGIERGRSDVALAELLDPGNLQRAGRFFEEIFTGLGFELDDFQQDSTDECVGIERTRCVRWRLGRPGPGNERARRVR